MHRVRGLEAEPGLPLMERHRCFPRHDLLDGDAPHLVALLADGRPLLDVGADAAVLEAACARVPAQVVRGVHVLTRLVPDVDAQG